VVEFEPVVSAAQGGAVEAIDAAGALDALGDQAGVAEDGEMAREGGHGDFQVGEELGDGAVAAGEHT